MPSFDNVHVISAPAWALRFRRPRMITRVSCQPKADMTTIIGIAYPNTPVKYELALHAINHAPEKMMGIIQNCTTGRNNMDLCWL